MSTSPEGPSPSAYRLAYDGRDYHGFQRQPDVATVEDALAGALADIGATDARGLPAGYTAAGRTDAGVSALAQTVAFAAPSWLTPSVLTDALPDGVVAWARADIQASFHARHHAVRRSYRYHLHGGDLADAALRSAVDVLSGYHDFRHFTPQTSGTIRRVAIDARRDGAWWHLSFHARGFVRQLVRRCVRAIAAVARGTADVAWLGRLLTATGVESHALPGPAPAEALVLTGVAYPGVGFEVEGAVLDAAGEAFAGRRVAASAQARAMATVAAGLSAR